MNLGLTTRSALVLAASKGLGKACALALAREGASVMIGARDPSHLERTAAEIRQETGANVHAHPVDVTDPQQIHAIFQAAESSLGRSEGPGPRHRGFSEGPRLRGKSP